MPTSRRSRCPPTTTAPPSSTPGSHRQPPPRPTRSAAGRGTSPARPPSPTVSTQPVAREGVVGPGRRHGRRSHGDDRLVPRRSRPCSRARSRRCSSPPWPRPPSDTCSRPPSSLAGALAIPAALGVGRLLRPRMPRLAALLVVVMSLSGLGLWAQAGFRSFVVSMVRDGSVPASAVESYTAFQENGLFDALLLPALALGALSTLVWVGALVRTRLAPFWVPAALLVGAVLASGEFPDAVTVGGAAVSPPATSPSRASCCGAPGPEPERPPVGPEIPRHAGGRFGWSACRGIPTCARGCPRVRMRRPARCPGGWRAWRRARRRRRRRR